MRGLCHGSYSLFLPVGARRPSVGVPHAPLGVAKRLCYCSPDPTSTHITTAPAQPRAETLCGPHHKASLRRLCARQRPPSASPFSPATPHRPDTRSPPLGRHLDALLSEPGLCLSGLGRLGQSPRQWPPQWRALAAVALHRLSPLLLGEPGDDLSWEVRLRRPHRPCHRVPG